MLDAVYAFLDFRRFDLIECENPLFHIVELLFKLRTPS